MMSALLTIAVKFLINNGRKCKEVTETKEDNLRAGLQLKGAKI